MTDRIRTQWPFGPLRRAFGQLVESETENEVVLQAALETPLDVWGGLRRNIYVAGGNQIAVIGAYSGAQLYTGRAHVFILGWQFQGSGSVVRLATSRETPFTAQSTPNVVGFDAGLPAASGANAAPQATFSLFADAVASFDARVTTRGPATGLNPGLWLRPDGWYLPPGTLLFIAGITANAAIDASMTWAEARTPHEKPIEP